MTVSVAVVSYKDKRGYLHESKDAALNADKTHYWYMIFEARPSAHLLAEQFAKRGILEEHMKQMELLDRRYRDV